MTVAIFCISLSLVAFANADVRYLVITPPDKTEYTIGETLDTSGLHVYAIHGNSTASEVTSDVTVSPTVLNVAGTIQVNVSYMDVSAQFEVEVINPNESEAITFTSLSITPPSKTDYDYGSYLDLTGFKATASLSNGAKADVTSLVMLDNKPLNTVGKNEIKVSFLNFTASFTVNVAPRLTAIKLTPPTNTEYKVGDTLDTAGMVVTASYSDGSTKDVTASATVDTTAVQSLRQSTFPTV